MGPQSGPHSPCPFVLHEIFHRLLYIGRLLHPSLLPARLFPTEANIVPRMTVARRHSVPEVRRPLQPSEGVGLPVQAAAVVPRKSRHVPPIASGVSVRVSREQNPAAVPLLLEQEGDAPRRVSGSVQHREVPVRVLRSSRRVHSVESPGLKSSGGGGGVRLAPQQDLHLPERFVPGPVVPSQVALVEDALEVREMFGPLAVIGRVVDVGQEEVGRTALPGKGRHGAGGRL
mmetsp:Transcript_14616/g.30020  ORF Transcript_14616/g.30020 Transcript_14616/m.30020 type:complete len:230 (-) Transcript_14616:148-837(-)